MTLNCQPLCTQIQMTGGQLNKYNYVSRDCFGVALRGNSLAKGCRNTFVNAKIYQGVRFDLHIEQNRMEENK